MRSSTAPTSTKHGNVVRRELSRIRSSSTDIRHKPDLRHERCVGSNSGQTSHKLQRTSLCTSSTQTVPALGHQSEHSMPYRQCHSTKLHQQEQWSQESQSARNLPGSPVMVPSPSHCSQSSSYQGYSECPFRLSEQEGHHNNIRMVHSSPNHGQNKSTVARSPFNRSFCHQPKCQVTTLCVTSQGSSSHEPRCSESQLGRNDRLCLSSSVDPDSSPQQDNSTQVHHLSCGSQLAQTSMVSSNPQSIDRCPSQDNSTCETVETTRNQSVSPKPSVFRLTRVQTVKQCLINRGFSPEAASHISEKNRGSSNDCYERYWQRYLSWCERSNVDPILASVTQLANFITFLINSKDLVPTTVDSIKSCVTFTLRFCTGIDYGNCIELTALLQKYHRECPAELFKLPSWNLVLVLEMLNGYPFEPLHEASIKHLTYKCVMLLSVACSCRVSELHALAFDKITHSKDWSTVYLEPKSDFLAKNQKSHTDGSSRCFKLQALVKPAHKTNFPPGSDAETKYQRDKLFCPVRALRIYLARTLSRRSKHKAALFVSLNANHSKDITKQSISNWVRHTIKLCYALAGENPENIGRASVHEIRALTSSVQYERNLSLNAIMKSCIWKNSNTFTRYYLRNVAVLSDDLYQFPPLWFAQGLIND